MSRIKLPLKGWYAYNRYGDLLKKAVCPNMPLWFKNRQVDYNDIVIYTGGYRIDRPQPYIKDFRICRKTWGVERILLDLRDVAHKLKKK